MVIYRRVVPLYIADGDGIQSSLTRRTDRQTHIRVGQFQIIGVVDNSPVCSALLCSATDLPHLPSSIFTAAACKGGQTPNQKPKNKNENTNEKSDLQCVVKRV